MSIGALLAVVGVFCGILLLMTTTGLVLIFGILISSISCFVSASMTSGIAQVCFIGFGFFFPVVGYIVHRSKANAEITHQQ